MVENVDFPIAKNCAPNGLSTGSSAVAFCINSNGLRLPNLLFSSYHDRAYVHLLTMLRLCCFTDWWSGMGEAHCKGFLRSSPWDYSCFRNAALELESNFRVLISSLGIYDWLLSALDKVDQV